MDDVIVEDQDAHSLDPNLEDEVDALTDLGLALIYTILDGEDMQSIQRLVDAGAPLWYQDEAEGISALHAAAYTENKELIELLIAQGAPWNTGDPNFYTVDNFGNTAGDIALSFNNETCYTAIRDAGIRTELLQTLLSTRTPSVTPSSTIVVQSTESTPLNSTEAFLSSRLLFKKDSASQPVCMVDVSGEKVGVMMGWERGIMQTTVDKLCAGHENTDSGLKILNVGFGLGIIDSLFQSLSPPPVLHVIIEPHPDVLRYMKRHGWHRKRGVKILKGKWQDYVGTEMLLGFGGFDVIFTDTFAEDYTALHKFFGHVPTLLAGPQSRFSFFNGLGATNALFYDVYTRVAELHLANFWLEVEWSDVDVSEVDTGDDRWKGSKEYFKMPLYRLPLIRKTTGHT